jgi:hypothetical protein
MSRESFLSTALLKLNKSMVRHDVTEAVTKYDVTECDVGTSPSQTQYGAEPGRNVMITRSHCQEREPFRPNESRQRNLIKQVEDDEFAAAFSHTYKEEGH